MTTPRIRLYARTVVGFGVGAEQATMLCIQLIKQATWVSVEPVANAVDLYMVYVNPEVEADVRRLLESATPPFFQPVCRECGEAMFITDAETAHHGAPDAIDHDADADHVAILDDTVQTWFAVDIPNAHDPEDSWVNIDSFNTRAEAIAYARTTFGADENGCICLIAEL